MLMVMNCRPLNVYNLPGVSGLLGLMVATSKTAGRWQPSPSAAQESATLFRPSRASV